jgi:hypothetical protein
MNLLQKAAKAVLITLSCLLFVSLPVHAVQVTGVGINRDQALNNAFQSAVEAEIGVAVKSAAVSENFMLIKKEIVTHSKGYVSRYRIINESTQGDATVTIEIEAKVNRNLLADHTQTLDILMKMSGHPKLLIFGVDQDFHAVPADTEFFNELISVVSQVFQEKFRFDVLDWSSLQTQYPDIEGRLTREMIKKYNNRFKANFVIEVGLNLHKARRDHQKARLSLTGIRISDNYILGETYRDIGPFAVKGLSQQTIFHQAVTAAKKEDIFLGSANLAKKIVETMHGELDRGHGFRYMVSFSNFPNAEELETKLTMIRGYVRHTIESKSNSQVNLAYWSNLKSDSLMKQIQGLLDDKGYQYLFKLDGRKLKFKWKHPEGF